MSCILLKYPKLVMWFKITRMQIFSFFVISKNKAIFLSYNLNCIDFVWWFIKKWIIKAITKDVSIYNVVKILHTSNGMEIEIFQIYFRKSTFMTPIKMPSKRISC